MANPNPITLAPGATLGKTTLYWNAPGYSQMVIQVGSTRTNMTGTLGSSGSADTGTWITNGMPFYLVDKVSGRTVAALTAQVVVSPR